VETSPPKAGREIPIAALAATKVKRMGLIRIF
jgi:hypothetical protein